MNIVDSSCWLEYFKGSPAGDEVSPIIEDVEHLLVPAIILYEVFKKLLIELDENKALFALAQMRQGCVVDLDADLTMHAAKISKEHVLPMADSIIYAVSRKFDATLWTQDRHFKALKSVRYFEKD